MTSTNAVATSIRAGRSHAGGRPPRSGRAGEGVTASARLSPATTSPAATGGEAPTCASASVLPAKASVPAARQAGQPSRRATRTYATANAAWESTPSRVPTAAAAAKRRPWSRTRTRATGPEVKGKPTSQPATRAPQRRATSEAAAISAGVSRSLTARLAVTGRSPPRSGHRRDPPGRSYPAVGGRQTITRLRSCTRSEVSRFRPVAEGGADLASLRRGSSLECSSDVRGRRGDRSGGLSRDHPKPSAPRVLDDAGGDRGTGGDRGIGGGRGEPHRSGRAARGRGGGRGRGAGAPLPGPKG